MQITVTVLGKYRSDNTQANVISVGTRVSLVAENGTERDYLLLRIVPVASVWDIWIFPVEYQRAEVPVVAMSANAFRDDIERSLKAGMNAHIMKPLDMKVVTRTLNEVLKK